MHLHLLLGRHWLLLLLLLQDIMLLQVIMLLHILLLVLTAKASTSVLLAHPWATTLLFSILLPLQSLICQHASTHKTQRLAKVAPTPNPTPSASASCIPYRPSGHVSATTTGASLPPRGCCCCCCYQALLPVCIYMCMCMCVCVCVSVCVRASM
jgi:hypothetical protein